MYVCTRMRLMHCRLLILKECVFLTVKAKVKMCGVGGSTLGFSQFPPLIILSQRCHDILFEFLVQLMVLYVYIQVVYYIVNILPVRWFNKVILIVFLPQGKRINLILVNVFLFKEMKCICNLLSAITIRI